MSPSAEADDLAQTKRLALGFLEHCFWGDMDQALALLAEDASWWVLGNPDTIKVAGERDMPRIKRFLKNVRLGFPTGIAVEFTGVTAEGERVAVEAIGHARLADGRDYRNRYHFLVQVRGGRVIHVREYLDTQYVYEVQLASEPPPRDAGPR